MLDSDETLLTLSLGVAAADGTQSVTLRVRREAGRLLMAWMTHLRVCIEASQREMTSRRRAWKRVKNGSCGGDQTRIEDKMIGRTQHSEKHEEHDEIARLGKAN